MLLLGPGADLEGLGGVGGVGVGVEGDPQGDGAQPAMTDPNSEWSQWGGGGGSGCHSTKGGPPPPHHGGRGMP